MCVWGGGGGEGGGIYMMVVIIEKFNWCVMKTEGRALSCVLSNSGK